MLIATKKTRNKPRHARLSPRHRTTRRDLAPWCRASCCSSTSSSAISAPSWGTGALPRSGAPQAGPFVGTARRATPPPPNPTPGGVAMADLLEHLTEEHRKAEQMMQQLL